MRKTLLLLLSAFMYATSFSAEITAKAAGGEWSVASTWVGNTLPVEGDVVIIPANVTVTFNSTPYPSNNPVTRPRLTINIYGTLDFSGAGNNKLYLDAGSRIQIFGTGQIKTTSNSTEIIAIYTGTGTTDNIVWEGTPSTITGPRYATSTSTTGTTNYGFAAGVLPVSLLTFTGEHSSNSVQLKWTTAEEINARLFEVERSTDSKTWTVAATVVATGSYSAYRAIDNLPLSGYSLYRLKTIDWDQKISYSPVIRIAADKTFSVQVSPNPARGSVQVSLSTLHNKPFSIQLINSNGQVVKVEQFGANTTNLVKFDLNSVPKGIYTLIVREKEKVLKSTKLQVQ